MKSKPISDAAIAVLDSGVSVVGHELTITTGQLDRKLYVEVNAVLEALGGKWNRKSKTHVFDGDPTDALDQVLADGVFTDAKRNFEQFFTPPALAKLVVERANVKGKIVLEPSAGHGALAIAAMGQGAKRVDCIELDGKCCEVLRAAATYVRQMDFLVWARDADAEYERVCMNPPFSRQQDIVHVTAAIRLVKPGGRLVAIMSAGVAFRTDKRTTAFRALVAKYDGTIEKLPEQSFKDSGTNVNTVLVTIDKR